MATNPIPSGSPEELPLSAEDGWRLFEALRGILKTSYAELGGAQQFHQEERQAWDSSESR